MKPHTWKIISFLVVAAVILSWGFYPVWSYIYKDWFTNTWLSEIGVFGDSFGALNTLFSGLAFTGIIISIFLQSQELTETRKDINRQTKEFESQTDALKKQVFENTFFQMLTVLKDNAGNAYYKRYHDDGESYETITGKVAFQDIFNGLQYSIFIEINKGGHLLESVRRAYANFDLKYSDSIGPYCRSLYQTLKLVDDSSMSNTDKKTYSNIIRAQLSRYEISIIFFCGLSIYGDGTFKRYLEKYEFFEHLSILTVSRAGFSDITDRLIKYYNVQAYGKTNKPIIDMCNDEVKIKDK